jgi:hypothetical protein
MSAPQPSFAQILLFLFLPLFFVAGVPAAFPFPGGPPSTPPEPAPAPEPPGIPSSSVQKPEPSMATLGSPQRLRSLAAFAAPSVEAIGYVRRPIDCSLRVDPGRASAPANLNTKTKRPSSGLQSCKAVRSSFGSRKTHTHTAHTMPASKRQAVIERVTQRAKQKQTQSDTRLRLSCLAASLPRCLAARRPTPLPALLVSLAGLGRERGV